ncbi:MAG: NepR family anti-sigma factor [Henriciella sp.]
MTSKEKKPSERNAQGETTLQSPSIRRLREEYESVLKQPVPQRLVDLVKRLKDLE